MFTWANKVDIEGYIKQLEDMEGHREEMKKEEEEKYIITKNDLILNSTPENRL